MSTYMLDARTVTPHFPGIGRYVTHLAQALEPLLEDAEQLTLLCPPGCSIAPTGRTHVRTVAATPFSFRQQWQVPAVLRALRADVYHSGYYLMPYATGLPTLVTLHDLVPLLLPELSSPRARIGFRWAVALALRRSRICITDSASSRADLLAAFRVSPAAVRTIPLAAAPGFVPQSQAAISAIRARYALPEQILLYVGSNKPHKNLVRLVSAYAPLASPAFPLVLAGPWDARYPEARHAAGPLPPDTVRWLGPIPEDHLPGLYAAASAFVFPSLYEGFGLPVIEAMACGTPVACANASSLSEVAGDAALMADPTDTQALTQILRRLMEDRELRYHLGELGRAQARLFSWTRTAAETLSLYREALES